VLCAKAARRVRAVTMADTVVCAGDIVKENCGPEARTLLRLPGGFDKTNGVNHHASDMRLAMQVTRVPEDIWQRNDAIGRKRDEMLGHSGLGNGRNRSRVPEKVVVR
jgi:hypothetical protein